MVCCGLENEKFPCRTVSCHHKNKTINHFITKRNLRNVENTLVRRDFPRGVHLVENNRLVDVSMGRFLKGFR